MQHGKLSAKIGKKIAESVMRSQRHDLTVFFDSGEKADGVKLPIYFGSPQQFGPQTILSEFDIVVADTNDGRILVMCHFGDEGAEPSRVLGDMAAVTSAEKLRIKGRDFTLDDAQCILGYRCEETKQDAYGMAQKRVESLGFLFSQTVHEEYLRGINFTLIARKDYEKIFEEMQRDICKFLKIQP